MDTADVAIRDDGSGRFEARTCGGRLIGVAEYDDRDGARIFPHTVVDPAHQGRGVGGALATAALQDARARGLHVVAACSFFQHFLAVHTEYADLVEPRPAELD